MPAAKLPSNGEGGAAADGEAAEAGMTAPRTSVAVLLTQVSIPCAEDPGSVRVGSCPFTCTRVLPTTPRNVTHSSITPSGLTAMSYVLVEPLHVRSIRPFLPVTTSATLHDPPPWPPHVPSKVPGAEAPALAASSVFF